METRLVRRHKSVNIAVGDYLDCVDCCGGFHLTSVRGLIIGLIVRFCILDCINEKGELSSRFYPFSSDSVDRGL